MKGDRKGGRNNKEIELGMKFMERRMGDDEHDEHSSIFNQGKQFIYQKQLMENYSKT